VQLPSPLSEYVPAAHAVATLAVHDDPAGQGMQVVAPPAGAYRPVGQVMTRESCSMGHMVPAAQVVHVRLVPSWYDPAVQRVKVGVAVALQLYPGGQGWHVAMPANEYCPVGHAAPAAVRDEQPCPAGQMVHEAALPVAK
jgi:hypothetical protein